MAHSCPDCGYTCYCGGDLDDILWQEGSEQKIGCTHCLHEDREDDWDDYGPIEESDV